MNVAAGQSDEPHKFNLENIIDRTRKLWDNTPTPVKSCFPWNRALDNFVQLNLDIVLTVTKYLYVPVLVVTSIIELSYCAHERKLYITLFPFLFGVAIAGILKSAAMESSPYLKLWTEVCATCLELICFFVQEENNMNEFWLYSDMFLLCLE
ncbi:uncharacterized protein [Nicotiana tomentosiformis]|uniref:uncharacterized protein n=1 Tax=Nicotiana tomentosiformis TaxID=4098 RepID=UPI00388CD0A6